MVIPVDPFDPWLALKVAVSRRGDPLNPISAANMSSFWTGPINGLANLSREHAVRTSHDHRNGFWRG